MDHNINTTILLTKTTAVQNGVALSYHRVIIFSGSCFCGDYSL